MEINEDVVINGSLTVNGDVVGGSVKSNAALIMGTNLLIDGQEGPLIDNDSNAKLTAVTASSLVLGGTAPSIGDATSPSDAVTKLNQLLAFLRNVNVLQ